MSDYSNLKVERVDDLPASYRLASRASKPLAPVHIFKTLPFLKDLGVNETIKIGIPEDSFTYRINDTVPRHSGNYYGSLKAALARTFHVIAEEEKKQFVFRMVQDDLFIKRVEG